MNNEIKEILDKLKSNNYPFGIATIDIEKLLDYITNLQEENKDIKTELNVVRKDYKAYMKRAREYEDYLQEENEKLKELNVCVGCENNPDYKLRNEKAIKYIEKLLKPRRADTSIHNNLIYVLEMTKILSILQGDDK